MAAACKIFVTFFVLLILITQIFGSQTKKKFCGQLLHKHIQNVCKTTNCQQLIDDGKIIETLDYKSKCCINGCSHHQYQSLCCYDIFVDT